MKLLPRYATATCLKIGQQDLLEQFFPLPFAKYLVVHGSTGMPAKNYPHFPEVLNLIKPHLAAHGIEMVQIGGKDDPALPHCYHTQGKTSLHQANYIVGRAAGVLGGDSCWMHRAGYLGLPIVGLYGPTAVANHSPYEYNEDKSIFIESHRWGRKPTFASQEHQSTMNVIPPEQVANAVLKVLDIPHVFGHKTLFVGPMFYSAMMELVPNCVVEPQFNPHLPMTVRMDVEFNEQALYQVLQTGRKVHIFTNKEINLQMLTAYKASILSYTHELFDSCPKEYVKQIKALIPPAVFFSRETHEDVLSRLRFHFFEQCQIQQAPGFTRKDFERAAGEYLNVLPEKVLDNPEQMSKLEFKTNKFVLSKGKIYLSHAHARAEIPMENGVLTGKVIDSDEFWRDLQHFYIYSP